MSDQHLAQPAAPSDAAWPPLKRRLFNEKGELDQRILKLSAEASESVDPGERMRIQKQVLALQTDSDLLKERLAAIELG